MPVIKSVLKDSTFIYLGQTIWAGDIHAFETTGLVNLLLLGKF